MWVEVGRGAKKWHKTKLGDQGVAVFVFLLADRIKNRRKKEKPYFPAAGHLFFLWVVFGVCCCLVIWFGCTIDSRNS